MAATASMFVTGMKNYQSNFQKSNFQKELNFTIDSIANDVKNGYSIPVSYNAYETSPEVLVVAIPAKDQNDNFIYTGENIELDYVIYYLQEGTLRKHVYGNNLGKKSSQPDNDLLLLKDVSSVNFQYSPGIANTSQVKIKLALQKQTGKSNILVSDERIANLRNKQ